LVMGAYNLGGSVDWSESGWADDVADISGVDTTATESGTGSDRDKFRWWTLYVDDGSVAITKGVTVSGVTTAAAHGKTALFRTLSWGPCGSWVLDEVVDTSLGLFASLADSHQTFLPSGFSLARLLVILADGGVGALFVREGIDTAVTDQST